MPYWRRPAVLDQNLEQYRKLYNGNIEVLVIDDGSPEPARASAPGRVIRLPNKPYALNPCVPFNRGADEAKGDIIVLTNPEVIHRSAILGLMEDELRRLGQRGYVAASCWNEDTKTWYCHSTLGLSEKKMGRAPIPKGAGLHFCSMLHLSLFQKVGGFSEEYRNGRGYEDNDFLWKLESAGATFRIMDDCVTDHVKCDPSDWRGPLNKELFESKWPNLSH